MAAITTILKLSHSVTTVLKLSHAVTCVIPPYTDTGTPSFSYRLIENGDYFLLENGDYKILG